MPIQRVPVICAWCLKEREARGLPPKVLGYSMIDVPPGVKEPASHGICAECEAKHFPSAKTQKGSSGGVQMDELADARRRKEAGEFLTQRQMQLLWGAGTPAAAKEPWQMTQTEFFRTPEGKPSARFPINVKHRAAVEQALREGKPVPPEVLKDYPDLLTRDDVRVEVWEERDRLHIGIQNEETGEYIVSWWDDDARQMFEDGFFKRGPGLKESVLEYAETHELLRR